MRCGICLDPISKSAGRLVGVSACKGCMRCWVKCHAKRKPALLQVFRDARDEAARIEQDAHQAGAQSMGVRS